MYFVLYFYFNYTLCFTESFIILSLKTTCLATRRQKELELQVLTGPVRGWEGPNLTSLGKSSDPILECLT